MLNTKNYKMKCILLGSAPYMKEWCKNHLAWFIENDYKVITFNNSWKLVEPKTITEWHRSADHGSSGTFIPTKEEETHFQTILHTCEMAKIQKISEKYIHYKAGTMFLNVMYYILVKKVYSDVVVVGCDMIYNKQGDTFYSDLEQSRAKNDPVNKYGEDGLNKELENCKNQFKQHKKKLFNASTSESRLTFDRFTKHIESNK